MRFEICLDSNPVNSKETFIVIVLVIVTVIVIVTFTVIVTVTVTVTVKVTVIVIVIVTFIPELLAPDSITAMHNQTIDNA